MNLLQHVSLFRLRAGYSFLIGVSLVTLTPARDSILTAEILQSDQALIRKFDLRSGKLLKQVTLELPPLLKVDSIKSSPDHKKFYISGIDFQYNARDFLIDTKSHVSEELRAPRGHYIADVSLGKSEQVLLSIKDEHYDPISSAKLKAVNVKQFPWITVCTTVNGDVAGFDAFPYLQRISKLREMGLRAVADEGYQRISYSWDTLASQFGIAPYGNRGYIGPSNSFVLPAGQTILYGIPMKIEQRHWGMNFVRYTDGKTIGFENNLSPLLEPRIIGPYTAFHSAPFNANWGDWIGNAGTGIYLYDQDAVLVRTLPGRLVVLVEGQL